MTPSPPASSPPDAALSEYDERDAQETDFEDLYALHERTMRRVVELTYGPWDEADQRQRFREAFTTRLPRVLATRAEPTSVPRIVAAFHIARRDDAHFLSSIEIAVDHQRRGLGSALVRQFVREALGSGRDATLQVSKHNGDAQRLYERLGLVVTGETETHVEMRLRRKGA